MMNSIIHYQGASSVEDATTSPLGGSVHPSLTQAVPAVKVTADPTSTHPTAPRMSTPTLLQIGHHEAETANPTPATSPSVTISPLGVATNALATSPFAEDPSTGSVPPGMRIRKSGLKRSHSCDQCSQCE